jgi:hypothetical protein
MNLIATTNLDIQLTQLPEAFAALQPFVALWTLDTETERNIQRHAQSMDAIRLFADSMMQHMEALIAFVNRKPMAEFDEVDATLLKLLLSLAEVAPAVEFYGQQEVVYGFDPRRFVAEEDFNMKPLF